MQKGSYNELIEIIKNEYEHLKFAGLFCEYVNLNYGNVTSENVFEFMSLKIALFDLMVDKPFSKIKEDLLSLRYIGRAAKERGDLEKIELIQKIREGIRNVMKWRGYDLRKRG